MKILGCCGCLFLSLLTAAAQSEPRPAPPVLTATNNIQRIFGPTAVYDGVLPEMKRRGGIISRPDLDAPVVPGKEFRNVSVHPHTGRPQGIVFIAVRF
jgi:hypothetical protein